MITKREEILTSFAKFIQSHAIKQGSGFLGYMERVGDKGDFLQPLFEGVRPGWYDWVNGNESFSKQVREWQKEFHKTGKAMTQKDIIAYLRNNV